MRTRKKKDWMWILFILGSVLTLAGAWESLEQAAFGVGAVATTGTIVELRRDGRRRHKNHVIPIVEYVAGKDDEFRFEGISTFYERNSEHNPYSVGDVVPVIYQPARPRHARINNEQQRWRTSKSFVLVGLGCLTVASAILWRRVDRKNKQDSEELETGVAAFPTPDGD